MKSIAKIQIAFSLEVNKENTVAEVKTLYTDDHTLIE
jgi:hypothetical protein